MLNQSALDPNVSLAQTEQNESMQVSLQHPDMSLTVNANDHSLMLNQSNQEGKDNSIDVSLTSSLGGKKIKRLKINKNKIKDTPLQ